MNTKRPWDLDFRFLYYFFLICINFLFSNENIAQKAFHLELLSRIAIPEHASSIWGFTDSLNREYALLGTAQGVRIYSLENPNSPQELHFISCTPSAWRELKTAGSYAYVTTEAADGLLIIDLNYLPDSIHYRFVKSFINTKGDSLAIISAHTLFVDEKNFIYLSGAQPIGAGFIILDPSKDPLNPVIINHNEDQYMHEVHVFNDILYGAELFHGVFSLWDIKDRTNPVRFSDRETSFHFTHSVWIEKNRNILYTADEVASAVVEAWDVSDPFQIKKTDQFKVKLQDAPNIIPHNVFHKDDKLFVSYYTEGVRILDTRDPENLIEVAYYDTNDEFKDGFHGCWSVFPYFNSGICIASDIENGMFVLRYDGNDACYVHATIRNKANGRPVSDASLKIISDSLSIEEFSNLQGFIKTGFPEEDSVDFLIYKKGFYPQQFKIKLLKSSTISLIIDLVELPKHKVNIRVKEKASGNWISDAKIILFNQDFTLNSNTDSAGSSSLHEVYENYWTLVVGKWAFKQFALHNLLLDSEQEIIVELEPGYEDDFILDLGWKTISTDPKVQWKLGDFSEISQPSSNFPSKDISGDLGMGCYYTDNYASFETERNIHGDVLLVSPPMNLDAYDKIKVEYHAWAYGGYISSKEILIITRDTVFLLEPVPELLTGQFNPVSKSEVNLTGIQKDSVHFIFKLHNDSATAHMAIRLLGAFDAFLLTGEKIVGTSDDGLQSSLKVFPNPVREILHFTYPDNSKRETLFLLNSLGQQIKAFQPDDHTGGYIDVSALSSGTYFLRPGRSASTILFIKW